MANLSKSIIRLPQTPRAARSGPERRAARPRGQSPRSPLPRYLTQEELTRFRRAVIAGGDARDVALFGVMYRYGLRAVETTLLLREDLDLGRRRIRIRRAKHGEPKEYPLAFDLVPALKRHLRKRTDR